VGRTRGIATAMNYVAKRRGVTRGMTMSEIRRVCPDAVILPGNYALYQVMSTRMCAIVRRASDVVEEYSIDECFADISERVKNIDEAKDVMRVIQADLARELGMTFSVGLGPTRVMAKIASKLKKPNGFCVLDRHAIRHIYPALLVGAVWGIGGQSARAMNERGIQSVADFIAQPEYLIKEYFSKSHVALWHELQGTCIHEVSAHVAKPHSISRTRTLSTPTRDRTLLRATLMVHIEHVCCEARQQNLAAGAISLFLKTQEFHTVRHEIVLPTPTALPYDFASLLDRALGSLYKVGVWYRASGVTVARLIPQKGVSLPLPFACADTSARMRVQSVIDTLGAVFGHDTVYCASGLLARNRTERDVSDGLFCTLPFMGIVT